MELLYQLTPPTSLLLPAILQLKLPILMDIMDFPMFITDKITERNFKKGINFSWRLDFMLYLYTWKH